MELAAQRGNRSQHLLCRTSEVVIDGLLGGSLDALSVSQFEEFLQSLRHFHKLLSTLQNSPEDESPLAVRLVAFILYIVVDTVGRTCILARMIALRAEILAFHIAGIGRRHLQGIDVLAYKFHFPITLRREVSIDETSFHTCADLRIGVGAEEDVVGTPRLISFQIPNVLGGTGRMVEGVERGLDANDSLCAIGLACREILARAEIIDIDHIAILDRHKGRFANRAYLFYTTKFLPDRSIAIVVLTS